MLSLMLSAKNGNFLYVVNIKFLCNFIASFTQMLMPSDQLIESSEFNLNRLDFHFARYGTVLISFYRSPIRVFLFKEMKLIKMNCIDENPNAYNLACITCTYARFANL